MEWAVKENLVKLGNNPHKGTEVEKQHSLPWTKASSPLCPEHNKCQEVISQSRAEARLWRCLRLQRWSSFILESTQGAPEWSEKMRVTWSDGCLRKMTLAAVCI